MTDKSLDELLEDIVEEKEQDHDRVVREILDMTEVFTEGEGPEGPWYYKSLTIQRKMNQIFVYDVDGHRADYLTVPDLSHIEDEQAAKRLKKKLDEVHEKSLEAL